MRLSYLLLCFFTALAPTAFSAGLASESYTIEEPRIGSASKSTLSSQNYTVTPGPASAPEEVSAPTEGGGRSGSRIRLTPDETPFISASAQELLPGTPPGVPLLGREANPGVVSTDVREGQETLQDTPAVSRSENRMRASIGESGAYSFFGARSSRLAVFFFVLALLLYVRARTAWGRKYRPF